MFLNPITTFFGVLLMLCPIVEMMWPELKGLCGAAANNIMGLGLISAQDGIKRTFTSLEHAGDKSSKLVSLLLWVAAGSFIVSGCAQANKLFNSPAANVIKAEVQALGTGTYVATISKDGNTLISDIWTCKPDDKTKLLACTRQP